MSKLALKTQNYFQNYNIQNHDTTIDFNFQVSALHYSTISKIMNSEITFFMHLNAKVWQVNKVLLNIRKNLSALYSSVFISNSYRGIEFVIYSDISLVTILVLSHLCIFSPSYIHRFEMRVALKYFLAEIFAHTINIKIVTKMS